MTTSFPAPSFRGQAADFHPEFSSFRDPSGFLFWDKGAIYRVVGLSYKNEFERASESGLYESCVREGLLLPFDVEEGNFNFDHVYKVLKPQLITQITYPYEWCFDQLKDAALLTLQVHRRALRHGMVLKDASAYNVQFVDGKPCLIDHLSFGDLSDYGMWPAYGQFCRHFLAPLALMAYADLHLHKLLQIHIDGIPLDLASRLLPFSTRLNLGMQMHLHLHARMVAKYGGGGKKISVKTLTPGQLGGIADSLEKVVGRFTLPNQTTEWGAYYSATNYSDQAFEAKKAAILDMVNQVKPKVVWDMGGNDGSFSRLISPLVEHILCVDVDPVAVNQNYLTCKKEGIQNVLPVIVDCTNPSPAIGFANKERRSLEERASADLILGLALIHHLVISNNVPLTYIPRYLSRLGKYLIIEFVPKSDSQVKKLLMNRKDIFADYTEDRFREVFSSDFSILQEQAIPHSDRKLFLMQRHGP